MCVYTPVIHTNQSDLQMQSLSKFQQPFFFSFLAEMEKRILKFVWNCKGSQRAKTVLIKNKEGSSFPISKLNKMLL